MTVTTKRCIVCKKGPRLHQRTVCVACRAAQEHRWYEVNRKINSAWQEENKRRAKAWRAANQKHIAAYNKSRREIAP